MRGVDGLQGRLNVLHQEKGDKHTGVRHAREQQNHTPEKQNVEQRASSRKIDLRSQRKMLIDCVFHQIDDLSHIDFRIEVALDNLPAQ